MERLLRESGPLMAGGGGLETVSFPDIGTLKQTIKAYEGREEQSGKR